MDGGRVLRAALTLLQVKQAALIAARVSQVLCVLLAVTALYLEQPMLFIIALLVFLGAMQEHVRADTRIMAAAFKVEDVMIPRERLESFSHGTTVTAALKTALTSWQPLYPVVNGTDILGVINREDILEHAASQSDGYIGELIDRSVPRIEATASLTDACAILEGSARHVIIVTRDGNYAGLLAYDRLADFLLMNEIRQKIPKDDDLEWSPPL
jgi:CBS domain-containing protein